MAWHAGSVLSQWWGSGPPPGSNVIQHGALHAFNATTLAEIYSSRTLTTLIAETQGFAPPTVFNGQVYMGTNQEIDVFGICPQPQGCLK